MDITQVRELLDRIPSRSDYEFRNFEIEAQGSWHRQVRYVLSQKEQLTDSITKLDAEIALANYRLTLVADEVERAIQAPITAADVSGYRRTRSDLAQQLAQIDAWIETYDPREFEDAAKGFESSESDHWSEYLGRVVGVELLADVKASRDSMLQLSLLPLSDYKKSVMITNQFATFLKRTAEQVESSLYPSMPESMPSSDTVDIVQETAKAAKTKRK